MQPATLPAVVSTARFDSRDVRPASRPFGLGLLRSLPTYTGPSALDIAYEHGFSAATTAERRVSGPAGLSDSERAAFDEGVRNAIRRVNDRLMDEAMQFGMATAGNCYGVD